MPTYHFRCAQCKKEIEMKMSFGSTERPPCPDCKTPTDKFIVPPAIQFKGSGFYKTDSAGGMKQKTTPAKEETKATNETKETKEKPVESKPKSTEVQSMEKKVDSKL